MPHKCPSCEADVPNVVPQTTLNQRLEAKNHEISLLRDELGKASDKAGRFDNVENERARLASELEALQDSAARRDALLSIGVSEASVAASFGALYQSAVAGADDESRPTFAGWLEDENGARANPLLAQFFAAGNDGPADPLASPTPIAENARPSFPAPNTKASPAPPAQSPRYTAAQLRSMFQNMSVDEVRAWQQNNGNHAGWVAPVGPSQS